MIRKTTFLMAGVLIGALGALSVTHTQLFTGGGSAVAASPDAYRQLDFFGAVFESVRANYVESPEEADLIESAIAGMLTSLDPHSSYLDAEEFQDMQVQTSGKFGGLGIEVTMEDGVIKVVSPIDGTPAARAGMLAGDLIIALDGETIQGLNLNEAVDMMRGAINTPITVTVKRQGVAKPFDVTIVRDVITILSVRSRQEDKIGYIRISTFNEQTYDSLKSAIEKIEADVGADNVQGYVLDLRNNPGGLLDQAIAVSDAFLHRGEIVSTRGRHAQETRRHSARDGDLAAGKPVIVLVNGGSASASEIVAGALQDHRRATILGTRSFGKGSVQTILPLGANGALRLTTARYYTPSGRSIQAKGIDPDIEVIQELPPELAEQLGIEPRGEASLRGHLTGDDVEEGADERSGSLAYVPPDPKDDKQLNHALDLLRGLQRDAAFPPDPDQVIPD
jgi:carboxyl-terminal processing protease